MIELLFLLLPVAAAYGYLMGRNTVQKTTRENSKRIGNHYYKGLNFLLSNEKDKAVDTLIKMIDEGDEHWDTQIAMGRLFRHRGELDRAIKLHQTIVTHQQLSLKQQSIALRELALDYVQAGFLERAEESFLHLLDKDGYHDLAVSQLLTIYQNTKEWQRGIDLYQQFARYHDNCSVNVATVTAHFHCQLAEQQQDPEQALAYLKQALVISPQNVRARMELAEYHLAQGKASLAYQLKLEVIKFDPIWCGELSTGLLEASRIAGKDKLLYAELESISERSTSAYLMQARLLSRLNTEQSVKAFLLAKLRRRASVKGLEALLKCYLVENPEDESNQGIEDLQQLITEQLLARPDYRCENCGFSTKTLYWLCPSCRNWDVVKPITGIDGD